MRTFTVVSYLWRAALKGSALPALSLLACIAVSLAQAAETYTVTLAFEVDGLDLDSGSVVSASSQALVPGASDIKIAYNAQRTVAAVVMASGAEGVELAFLPDTGMNAVSSATLANLSFSPEAEDRPFTVFDTVVVKTETGAYYKLGNVSEQAAAVTFDYQRIE